MTGLRIRTEDAADRETIGQINRLAFGQDDEGRLVDALREGGFMRLSLVAEVDGQAMGHILFSAIRIVDGGEIVNALAVAPERQRQGVGSALVRAGLDRCRNDGHRIVIVVGHPGFYPRFGFSPKLAERLQSEYAGDAFMALEFVPGALDGVTGEVRYSPPFAQL